MLHLLEVLSTLIYCQIESDDESLASCNKYEKKLLNSNERALWALGTVPTIFFFISLLLITLVFCKFSPYILGVIDTKSKNLNVKTKVEDLCVYFSDLPSLAKVKIFE